MQNTELTMKSVINYFFQNRCLAQKASITTSTYLVEWNTSDPENYQVFLASLGRLSFFDVKTWNVIKINFDPK